MSSATAQGTSPLPRVNSRPAGPRPPVSPPQTRSPFTAISPSSALYLDSFENAASPSKTATGTLSRGTVIHKGFFDLLSIIPNTASTLGRWQPTSPAEDNIVAGPKYEDISLAVPKIQPPSPENAAPRGLLSKMSAILPPLEPTTTRIAASISGYFAPQALALKYRHVTKDIISSPTGFVHLVHAADAAEAEALLLRWGPDGMGKVATPYWADPIKRMLRNQEEARNRIATVKVRSFPIAYSDAGTVDADRQVGPNNLRIVNGASAFTVTTDNSGFPGPPSPVLVRKYKPNGGSKLIDTDIKSHFRPVAELSERPGDQSPTITPTSTVRFRRSGSIDIISIPDEVSISEATDGHATRPSFPLSVNSSRGWLNSSAGLKLLSGYGPNFSDNDSTAHTMHPSPIPEDGPLSLRAIKIHLPPPAPAMDVEPSIATLDKAASAKIYFESLYFPILRQPPSREQRRMALERDLVRLPHLSPAAKDEIRERWRQNESDYLREKRLRVSAESFSRLKIIGHGAFGIVSLVVEQSTGRLYAMKQLRKTDMLRKGQEGHVRAEREVLKAASLVPSAGGADWIVKLHYSFQDQDNLYLVLEYMGGGDLLNLLIERDIFEENFARFYVAEMILAVEQCHKQGFIHRDIKPDNFLFDPNGHIKLSDFGLATDLHWAHDTSYYEHQRKDLLRKYGIDLQDGEVTAGRGTRKMSQKQVEKLMGGGQNKDGSPGGVFTWRDQNRRKLAYSVCGTNSYMGPEVIRGHGYSFSCDWWSLGVIMYECLYGFPPFVSSSRHQTRQMILNWRNHLSFPSTPRISLEGVDLLRQLLCEPEDRIGSQTTASTMRPNSIATQARMSTYFGLSGGRNIDGADKIKAHPWFRGINWSNIHLVKAPFRPDLRDPADTKHFDDDIPAEPLAAANGAPTEATKDPLLKDDRLGNDIMNSRKQLAFMGFTHRSPRTIAYPRANAIYQQTMRGRAPQRNASSSSFGRSRALSM